VAGLRDGIAALDINGVLAAVDADLAGGRDPLELVDEARAGLEEVGDRFEKGEFYLVELIRAAQVFQAAAEKIDPAIREMHGEQTSKGKMVIATVEHDIHDLGKNIVKILLECKGIEVVDLGVNVRAEDIVTAVEDHQPDVVGLSALLTASVPEMNNVVTGLEEAGIREGVKVICGGGIVGEVRDEMKADFSTVDANEGVKVIEKWLNDRSVEDREEIGR
jgi:5-methyltetrahydrofolate--homocysteine methyltransferase